MAASLRHLVPVLALAAALATGCTASSQPKASSSGPATSSASASLPSPTPSDSPSESSSDPTNSSPTESPSLTDTDTNPSDDGSPTSPGPVPTNASGRPLTLADVFSVEGEWKDDRYDIADRAGLTGIGTVTDACSPNYASILELRLARGFAKLRMEVGQANNSTSSDAILVVTIVTNGKQIDTRRVPFNKLQAFQEDITAVNALRLMVYVDPDSCQSSSSHQVTAVIQGLTVS